MNFVGNSMHHQINNAFTLVILEAPWSSRGILKNEEVVLVDNPAPTKRSRARFFDLKPVRLRGYKSVIRNHRKN